MVTNDAISSLPAAVVVRLFSLGLILATISCDQPAKENLAQTAPPASSTSNSPAASAAAHPGFARVVGRWLRPDGGYVLELRKVEASGSVEAVYFNPNPIHVARAAAIQDGDKTKLFIELRDVNYPGCTYSLQYDAATDQLFGEYFQAAVRETFDVTFSRLKPGE